MLSVCIPVYNTDIRLLVRQLLQQAESLGQPVELIVMDDASEESYKLLNREIRTLPGVAYSEQPINNGRSKIRNLLASRAGYPYLLFLDADSLLPGDRFLSKYADHVKHGSIICGGTAYPDEKPGNPESLLRWTYGRRHEQINPAGRSKKPFAITSNNFVIHRETFLQHPFRESIRSYGHEDTVLGYDLWSAGIEIVHIDNPVIHTGLENSEAYLDKTQTALANLLLITRKMVTDPVFSRHSGLLRIRNILEKLGLRKMTGAVFIRFEKRLRKHLTGPAPRLFLFNLYRIGYICSLN